MTTERDDPHVALGIEHGRWNVPPYRWQDAEHQRRYDLGYAYGKERDPLLPFSEFEHLMRERGLER